MYSTLGGIGEAEEGIRKELEGMNESIHVVVSEDTIQERSQRRNQRGGEDVEGRAKRRNEKGEVLEMEEERRAYIEDMDIELMNIVDLLVGRQTRAIGGNINGAVSYRDIVREEGQEGLKDGGKRERERRAKTSRLSRIVGQESKEGAHSITGKIEGERGALESSKGTMEVYIHIKRKGNQKRERRLVRFAHKELMMIVNRVENDIELCIEVVGILIALQMKEEGGAYGISVSNSNGCQLADSTIEMVKVWQLEDERGKKNVQFVPRCLE